MPTNETIELFARYGGLIGLIIGTMFAAMTTAITFLWRHNLHLQAELKEVQNKRVEEAKDVRRELIAQSEETRQALVANAAAVNAIKDAVLIHERGRGR